MTDDQVLHIVREINNGRGNHGSFLRAFGKCVVAADPSNFALMRATALLVIGKYDLDRYLDNFPANGFPPDPAKRVRS